MKTKTLFFMPAILMLIVFLFSCHKKPNADFSTSYEDGTSSEKFETHQYVHFSDLSINASGREWDFGDQTTSTEKYPTHKYSTEGSYTVKLKATPEKGKKSDETSKTIHIEWPATKFIGTYSATRISTILPSLNYTIIISKGASATDLNVYGMLGSPTTDPPGKPYLNTQALNQNQPTTLGGISGYITDENSNIWSVNPGGQIQINGTTVTMSFSMYNSTLGYDNNCTITAVRQ